MKKGKKGIGSLALDFIMVILVLGGVLAFFRVTGITDGALLMSWARNKSTATENCYKNKGKGCVTVPTGDSNGAQSTSKETNDSSSTKPNKIVSDEILHYTGPSSGKPYLDSAAKFTKDTAKELLGNLGLQEKTKTIKVKDLTEWSVGAPLSKTSCWSSKDEVLYSQSAKGSVKLVDKDRKEVKNKATACSIKSGTWVDPYTGNKIKDKEDATVDFIIPIDVVNSSGGSDWTSEKKREYSNDTSALLVMSKKTQKEKGSKTIKDFSPKGKVEKCTLAKNYISVASKYSLNIDKKDKEALDKIITSCNR